MFVMNRLNQKVQNPQFRLQSHEPFPLLCQQIANNRINSRNYRYIDKPIIFSFISEPQSPVEHLLDKFPPIDIQLFLIVRGSLSTEVLLVAFKKRYRDVVADRTEFGHPDVALVLTQLSYYYSGLNNSLLSQCFNLLNGEEPDPASIYNQWILNEDEKDILKNAIVVNNLLKNENENDQFLLINVTSENILKQIVDYKETIHVILDVGALFIDGTNRDIAIQWLNLLSDKNAIDLYVVYFDSDSIVVCDRQLYHYPFVTSPASERLDRCIFYLYKIHARRTDFKFSMGFKAAVTLENGLTKDRCIQAGMRMRKLGNSHSLTFWSPYEVHEQIKTLKKKSPNKNDFIKLIDILRWVYKNTQQSTWEGLHHWAI
ncbi:unnamed protein product [Rotaria sp. Silwood2]|nr:unnamed protein product [Rotaria sp. Silwood2]